VCKVPILISQAFLGLDVIKGKIDIRPDIDADVVFNLVIGTIQDEDAVIARQNPGPGIPS